MQIWQESLARIRGVTQGDNAHAMRTINAQVSDNFANVRLWHLALVVGIFALLLGLLTLFGITDTQVYPQIQKDIFLRLNSLWQHAPLLAHNLTQLGDATVLFALLLCFALIAPKFWEALVAGSLLSLVVTHFLKALYAIPRPARAFGENAFSIIGEKLTGANSLPSGHTVTIWTTLTVLLFAFLPREQKARLSFMMYMGGGDIASYRHSCGAIACWRGGALSA